MKAEDRFMEVGRALEVVHEMATKWYTRDDHTHPVEEQLALDVVEDLIINEYGAE